MTSQFAVDLRLARRKAGLTQQDVAHLLDIQQTRLSELERGRKEPTLRELCCLSIILNRRFEGLYADLLDEARFELRERLPDMPRTARLYLPTFNRTHTLKRLRRDLELNDERYGGGV
jgi:transcriptional regulator with XRE-family HTH domain